MSEYGNVIQQSFGAESAQARVVGNQLDPEKAQRAVEIGEATGFEPHVVSENLEEFDQYHKASLGAQIVRKNQALKQYIDGHPMAAAVSGDDLGQLDTVSDRVKDLNEEDTNPLTKLAHIFAEGYGEGPVIGGWVMNNPRNFNEDGTLKYPYATAIASGLGAFLEVPMRAFGGAMALTEAGIESGYAGVTGDESGGKRLARDFSGMVDTYMNTFMGRTPRAREFNSGIRENIQKVALDRRAQMYWQSGKALPIGLSKEFDAAIERVSKEYWKKIDDLASEADKSATKERNPEFFRNFMEQHPELDGAYIRVAPEAVRKLYGEDVPTPNDGLLGFIDNLPAIMKVGEDLGVGIRVPVIDWVTKLDKETRDLLKDDSRAKLQTVSPKEAEDLTVWHQKYTVDEEGVTKGEYEEPPKAANDQDIAGRGVVPTYKGAVDDQLFRRYAKDADIRDFTGWKNIAIEEGHLALDKPNAIVAARAHSLQGSPTILIMPSGQRQLFVNGERLARDRSPTREPPIPRAQVAIDSVRQSSGLEPMDTIMGNIKEEAKYGSEKLKLARLDEGARKDLDINLGSKDAFDVTDEKGNVVGTLQGQKQGTNFFVDWVSSRAWAQSFGPKQVRALIQELKREYPDLETISGDRVSGARGDTTRMGERVTIKLEAPEVDQIFEEATKRKVQPTAEWITLNEEHDVKALVKPKAFLTENEKQIGEIVNDVIKKIIPEGSAAVAGASRVWHGGDVHGLYVPFKDSLPLILWSLASNDRVHTAGHEAMHHLRQIGAITKEEWKILEEAVDKEGWMKKYDIDARYKDLDMESKFEEAIAEKFGDVVAGKVNWEGTTWSKIAEKVRDFVLELRTKLKEAFGKEITADDIFERARTGGMKRRSLHPERPDYAYDANDPAVGGYITKAQRPEKPKLPPIPADHMRFFHSGDEPTSGGGRWVNESEKYVTGYREGQSTHYVDIPNSWLDKKFPDTELYRSTDGTARQSYPSFEAPEEFAKKMKPVEATDKAPKRPEQLDLSGITRIEDQQVFEKAAAAGMTVKQYKQYMQAIEKVREADKKYQEDKALAYEKKKQTKEWKTEAEALEPKVREDLEALPDYRVNEFFRTGILDGEQLPTRPKIGVEYVTSGEVPEFYTSKKGMHPDDIAGLLGIDSGKSLVDMLAGWKEAQGDVPAAKFVQDLIKGEVERRMSEKHGPLSENIIDAARDHVINNAQLELIHQEVLAAALRAGSDMPISKKEMEAFAKEQFSQAPIGNVSLEEMLREMGKSQRAAAMALLDGDPKAAFKHEQKRMLTFYAAREAKKLETAQRVFDRNVKRFSEREVTSFPQEYTNFIHDIMMKLGAGKLNFTFEDWQKRVAAEQHANLWDFTNYKMQNDLLEIKYDDRLFDDTLFASKPPLDNLTVEQFMNAHGFIQSLIKNGRDEFRIERQGQITERAAIKTAIIDQIRTLDPMSVDDAKGGSKMFKVVPAGLSSIIRTIGAVHWQMESIINRIDRGNPFGPFTQHVMRPLVEGANYVGVLERKYAAKLKGLDDGANIKEKVPNNLFIEPTTLELDPAEQRFMPMTRENLRKVIMYWGSESGRKKLSEGYNLEPQRIQAWLDQHATKEDYEWAKGLGQISRDLKDEIDVMYTNVAGVPPEDIKLAKLTTPHGDYDGWYHPLVPHPNVEMSRVGGAPTYAKGLVQQNFFRSTTANGHIMRRTGAVYALDLGLDSTASIMKRQIYDLAMRPGLIEAGRFLKDREIKTAITRHMGKEITDLINPYLEDVANASNNNDAAANMGLRVWNAFRSNVIGTMVGLNPGTIMKHGPTALVQSLTEVGPINFAKAVRNLWGINQRTGERNWNFAMQTSEELQRRHQNYLETLKGQNAQVLGKTTAREKSLSVGSWPVAFSDILSAVPTWMAQYDKTMSEGMTHGDAVYMADRAVRRAHGSTAITNRPTVQRGGFGMSILNPVYGFFSHILNRQYEMAWRTSDAVGIAKAGQVGKALTTMPWLVGMLVSYVIAPAIIEELVSPLPFKPDDGWGTKAAKTFGFGLGSSWIGVRDVAHFWAGGFNPSIGITGPMTQATRDLINDMSKGRAFDEANIGKTIKHSMVAAGMLTGLTNAQMGRWAQLAYEYSIDKDVPDGYWQWLVATRYGTIKGHSKTPEEYVEHLTGAH